MTDRSSLNLSCFQVALILHWFNSAEFARVQGTKNARCMSAGKNTPMATILNNYQPLIKDQSTINQPLVYH